jgi:hypothetical protein
VRFNDTYIEKVTGYAGGRVYETDKERSQEASEKMPYPGSADGFKKFVRDVATRNHCFEYEKIVIVSDGATWIRAMCDELFPGPQQIPGCCHLAENIYGFGKHIFSNEIV